MACSKSFNFLCASNAYVIAPEMKKSESWDKMYNKRFKEPLLAVKIQVLFDRFKAELGSRGGKEVAVERREVEEQKESDDSAVDFSDFDGAKKLLAAGEEEEMEGLAILQRILQGREVLLAKAFVALTGGLILAGKWNEYMGDTVVV
jgi:hypothetical protein